MRLAASGFDEQRSIRIDESRHLESDLRGAGVIRFREKNCRLGEPAETETVTFASLTK